MAKTKKQARNIKPVHVQFNGLSNENKSIYLDFFMEMLNSAAKMKKENERTQISLHDWMLVQLEKKRKKYSAGTVAGHISLMHILSRYGDRIPLQNADKEYCLGFIDYLNSVGRNNLSKKRLSKATVNHYYEIFTAALNAAVREGLVASNPLQKIDSSERPHRVESTRSFLTIEEVKQLIATPARRPEVKQAFLFSCFCGLRWSDVSRLTWRNIEENNGRHYANIVMKKNHEALYLPLNEQALQFMPKKPENATVTDTVFAALPTSQTVNRMIKKWAKSAGITKNVSFHIARHTFATTSLTLGADIYTTSKLLGHSNISITQVYAKIVNSKKIEAVDLFNKVF